MSDLFAFAVTTFQRGGPVMWPLLVVSIVSVALILERALFWLRNDRPGRWGWVEQVADRLRAGDEPAVRAIIAKDRSIYSRIVRTILAVPVHEAMAVEVAEQYRRELERFSGMLSTIITAAPLLGILGTVTGIIASFELLGRTDRVASVTSVAAGIAEALITTAAGLIVALVTLFPYMTFRTRADQCLSALELLVAARQSGLRRSARDA